MTLDPVASRPGGRRLPTGTGALVASVVAPLAADGLRSVGVLPTDRLKQRFRDHRSGHRHRRCIRVGRGEPRLHDAGPGVPPEPRQDERTAGHACRRDRRGGHPEPNRTMQVLTGVPDRPAALPAAAPTGTAQQYSDCAVHGQSQCLTGHQPAPRRIRNAHTGRWSGPDRGAPARLQHRLPGPVPDPGYEPAPGRHRPPDCDRQDRPHRRGRHLRIAGGGSPVPLARDNAISSSTAYEYRDEGIAVLAARRPSLHGALLAAKVAGHSHVITDGTLIYTDRIAAPGHTSGWTCGGSGKHSGIAFTGAGGRRAEELLDLVHRGTRRPPDGRAPRTGSSYQPSPAPPRPPPGRRPTPGLGSFTPHGDRPGDAR